VFGGQKERSARVRASARDPPVHHKRGLSLRACAPRSRCARPHRGERVPRALRARAQTARTRRRRQFALPGLLYRNIATTDLYSADWGIVGASITFKVRAASLRQRFRAEPLAACVGSTFGR
jgi:hypothetical protein